MVKVTQKQRFLKTLLGDGSDRFPFYDLEPDEETISRWHGQGYPKGAPFSEYFNLEPHHSIGLTLRSYPFFHMAPDLLRDPSSFDRHYNPDDPTRYGEDFVKHSELLEKEGRVVYVDASGGGLLQMLGVGDWQSFVSACFALVKRAEFVEDLVNRTGCTPHITL